MTVFIHKYYVFIRVERCATFDGLRKIQNRENWKIAWEKFNEHYKFVPEEEIFTLPST